MAKDRLLFLVSLALLAFAAAFLFRHTPEPPPPESPTQQQEKVEVKSASKSERLPTAAGKIAIPFQLSRQGIVQFLTPGMTIDIIFSSKAEMGFGTVTVTLLKNIRILGIGKDSEGKEYNDSTGFNKSNGSIEVLLEMTSRQSEIFSFAELSGNISFAIDEGTAHIQEDDLVKSLLTSESEENFNSILMTHMIRQLFPNVNVKITSTLKGYIIEGKTSQRDAKRIIAVLDTLASGGQKAVVNLMDIEDKERKPPIIAIAPGKRVVSLQVPAETLVSEDISLMSFVNVVFSPNPDIGFDIGNLALLKNIRVVGIRPIKEENLSALVDFKEVFLEMFPRQTEIFGYAQHSGKLSIEYARLDYREPSQNLANTLVKSDSLGQFQSTLLTSAMTAIFRDLPVKIKLTPKAYVIEGEIADPETAKEYVKMISAIAEENKKSVVNLLKTESQFTEVLIAEKELKASDILNPKDYSWKEIKTKDLSPTLISRNSQTEKWLLGALLTKEVSKGEMITLREIVWPEGIDVHKVEPDMLSVAAGMRVVPLQIPPQSSVTHWITPGTTVDVMLVPNPAIGFDMGPIPLLQNVRVLGIKNYKNKTHQRQTDFYSAGENQDLLLEMTPQQTEILSYAQQSGNFSLELAKENFVPNDDLVERLLESKSSGEFYSTLLTHTVSSFFPRIAIKVTTTPKGFVVEGRVPDPQVADKIMEIFAKLVPGGDKTLVSLLEIAPQQVLLEVTVLEVQKDISKDLGINWKVLFSNNGESAAFAAVFPPPPVGSPTFTFSADGIKIGANLSLSALINMLEVDGYARILAEPNLTTVSGETAHFFAGGEFPILIPQGGQLLGTVTVEFKKYGVLLDFTPFVDINGLITLHVVPEVSNLDKASSVVLSGFVIPGLLTRRVDTIVKLWPGQSLLIAGMYLDQGLNTSDNLYGLDRLPVIGPLFASKHCEDQRKELMVIVTPYLTYEDRPIEVPCPPCDEMDCANDGCSFSPRGRAGSFTGQNPR